MMRTASTLVVLEGSAISLSPPPQSQGAAKNEVIGSGNEGEPPAHRTAEVGDDP